MLVFIQLVFLEPLPHTGHQGSRNIEMSKMQPLPQSLPPPQSCAANWVCNHMATRLSTAKTQHCAQAAAAGGSGNTPQELCTQSSLGRECEVWTFTPLLPRTPGFVLEVGVRVQGRNRTKSSSPWEASGNAFNHLWASRL